MTVINYFVDIVLIVYSLYFFTFVIIGLFDNKFFRFKKEENSHPESKFAIFVPAHNEKKVIPELLKNLKDLNYPSSLYDVFVIADNCQDNTALVASRYDVNVLERINQEKKGKGYALKYGFDKAGILDGESDYDAVTVFDADNLVKENFLQVMDRRIGEGEKIIQSYLDSKNPIDSWVTATFSMMFWVNNRFIHLSRYNVGLSAVLMGTGMCISTDVLSETGWETTTLTEDLEYSIQALFRGIKTSFARETKVFDEKPVSFLASCRQRLRWARGQLCVLKTYIPRLFYRGIKEKSPVKLDSSIRLFQMPFLMFYFAVTALRWIVPGFSGPIFHYVITNIRSFGIILPLMPIIIPSLVFLLDRLPERAFKYVFMFPVFMYSWVAVLYWALFTMENTEWLHTRHFRDLSKQDIKESRLAALSGTKNVDEVRSKSFSSPYAPTSVI